MMKKTILFFLPLFLAIALLLKTSCTPESCFEETNAYLKASFYLESTGKLQAPDSLTLFGSEMDTLKIYNKASGISRAQVPLNSSAESCSLVFIINDTADTVTFFYNSYPHLISKECGYTFYHNIEQTIFTKNIIDNVKILKSTVTTFNEENILIYY
jgi:hypothetical protein